METNKYMYVCVYMCVATSKNAEKAFTTIKHTSRLKIFYILETFLTNN